MAPEHAATNFVLEKFVCIAFYVERCERFFHATKRYTMHMNRHTECTKGNGYKRKEN